jgi:hypothetical protein
MTRNEFFQTFNKMMDKHPMIKASKQLTVNELVYVLRIEGETDFCINTNSGNEFGCIPSVRETFVPTKTLAKKITSIDWEQYDECEFGGIVVVNLK